MNKRYPFIPESLCVFSGNDKKELERAIKRIEDLFCPRCKKRIIRVVSGKDCLVITKKMGHRKYRKVRCKNFKAMKRDK